MRTYSGSDVRKFLAEGSKCEAPISMEPSRFPPFRAIVEAAGLEGGPKTTRITRKRFIHLMMSTGNSPRYAEFFAWAVHRIGASYRDGIRRFIIPAILEADAAMARYRENREELMKVRKQDDQEG